MSECYQHPRSTALFSHSLIHSIQFPCIVLYIVSCTSDVFPGTMQMMIPMPVLKLIVSLVHILLVLVFPFHIFVVLVFCVLVFFVSVFLVHHLNSILIKSKLTHVFSLGALYIILKKRSVVSTTICCMMHRVVLIVCLLVKPCH